MEFSKLNRVLVTHDDFKEERINRDVNIQSILRTLELL